MDRATWPGTTWRTPRRSRARSTWRYALVRPRRRATSPFSERRLYRCIDTDEPWAAPREGVAPFVMSVALEPPPDQVDDFHAWYREEHSPMLMAAKGWRRIRRYEQVEGHGPRFMALHELDSLDGFDSKEYEAALATPWRIRVTGAVVGRERLRWELIPGA